MTDNELNKIIVVVLTVILDLSLFFILILIDQTKVMYIICNRK